MVVMSKKIAASLLAAIFIFMFSGCATLRKQDDLQTQDLRNQNLALQAQLQAKNEEVLVLKGRLRKATEEKQALFKSAGKKRVIGEVKSRPKAKQIQIALRNAGFSPGRIDGKIGKKTKKAIKAFQRDNNLGVDGKVGKRTWAVLRGYLYKKVK